jgi:crossover junction endodeoxyribonuclease RuvC
LPPSDGRPSRSSAANARAVRILGIDPGSQITGFGLIEALGQDAHHVASGCIRTAAGALPQRLRTIYAAVSELMASYAPAEIAVERVFVSRNADSALKLGQARGAALCATFGVDVSIHEYAPRAIKLAVVGHGGADKQQVQHMVRVLLHLDRPPAADAADALAVALCHAQLRRTAALIAEARLRA